MNVFHGKDEQKNLTISFSSNELHCREKQKGPIRECLSFKHHLWLDSQCYILQIFLIWENSPVVDFSREFILIY